MHLAHARASECYSPHVTLACHRAAPMSARARRDSTDAVAAPKMIRYRLCSLISPLDWTIVLCSSSLACSAARENREISISKFVAGEGDVGIGISACRQGLVRRLGVWSLISVIMARRVSFSLVSAPSRALPLLCSSIARARGIQVQEET